MSASSNVTVRFVRSVGTLADASALSNDSRSSENFDESALCLLACESCRLQAKVGSLERELSEKVRVVPCGARVVVTCA